MNRAPFGHSIDFTLDDLNIEPFLETKRVRDFDCGDSDLNDFLNTEEVTEYEREYLGKTYLVFHEGAVVAYFTVCGDGLRVEYLKTHKSFSKFSELQLEALPAIKIGRLAVDIKWQNRGIGRLLMKYIIGMALEKWFFGPARLIIIQANPEAVSFYGKCGFQLTYETKRERKRRNRTMFLDLYKLEERLESIS